MTLQVPFNQFLATVERLAKGKDVYLGHHFGRVLLTAAHDSVVIVATSNLPVDTIRKELAQSKLNVFEGQWAFEGDLLDELEEGSRPFVGAVAYATPEGRPGLWVDAFEAAPTDLQVLQAMFAEMTLNGEVEMNFDTFIKVANASVAVVGPDELANYVKQKRTV
jgi:hypothetical protein